MTAPSAMPIRCCSVVTSSRLWNGWSRCSTSGYPAGLSSSSGSSWTLCFM